MIVKSLTTTQVHTDGILWEQLANLSGENRPDSGSIVGVCILSPEKKRRRASRIGELIYATGVHIINFSIQFIVVSFLCVNRSILYVFVLTKMHALSHCTAQSQKSVHETASLEGMRVGSIVHTALHKG